MTAPRNYALYYCIDDCSFYELLQFTPFELDLFMPKYILIRKWQTRRMKYIPREQFNDRFIKKERIT